MIAKVLGLQKDGNEQPQFYELKVKYDGVGSPDLNTGVRFGRKFEGSPERRRPGRCGHRRTL